MGVDNRHWSLSDRFASQALGVDSPRTGLSRVVSSQLSDLSVVNSTTETDMFNFTLPTTLQIGDVVRLSAVGDLLNNSGSSINFTFKLYVGTTATLANAAAAITTAANRRKWVLNADVVVVAPASAQRVGGVLVISNQSSSNFPLSAGSTTTASGYATAAEDLTSAKACRFTVTLGTADATGDCYCHAATATILKAA